MRIWLIQTGEPLPIDSPNVRLFRTGMLAERLVSRGHEVVWWAATASHAAKRQRADNDTVIDLSERYRIRLVKAPIYQKNVSLVRIVAQQRIAKGFARLASTEPQPDLIVSSLPTIEVSVAVSRYAAERGVPLILDVRDMWPDLILDLAPQGLRWATRLVLRSMIRGMREACSQASAIIGTTEAFVDFALGYAGRPRGPADRDFPMAYTATPPAPESQKQAHAFWAEHGLVDDGHRQFIICFFGAMGRQTELDTVIEAARLLRDRGRDTRFVLCGTGDRLESYRRQASGLDNVLLPGWVGAAEIWTLMRIASVGLAPYANIPNYVFGLPNKPVEYISAGLPIVTGLRGVLSDLLERHCCGATYEFGRPESLADTLDVLNDDRAQRAALSRNAAVLYHDRFTAEAVFSEMADFLESFHVASRVV